ncbi:MAG TPA: tetratricopeptide repeat protein [Syntrophobacteria bacterium]|nr:tetratricopeptide repeat protein [Syntrophobacteria bacterium]
MAARTKERGAGPKITGWLLGVWVAVMVLTGCAAPSDRRDSPRLTEARRLAVQGSTWYRQGCVKRAEEYFYQALEASRLVDDVEGMVRAHNNLAVVAIAQGYYDEASGHLSRALELNKSANSAGEGPLILGNLGTLAYKLGRLEEAERFWREALAASEDDARHPGRVVNLNNLGMLLRQQGKLQEADVMLRRALSVGGENGQVSAANTNFQLALLAQTRSDLVTAERHLSVALALDKETEHAQGIAQDLEHLGILHQRQQAWDRAATELDRAIRLYAALGNTAKVTETLKLLEANREASGIPESVEVYRRLLLPPGEEWESPLCQ